MSCALESREPAAANSGLDQAARNQLDAATVTAPSDPLTEQDARRLTDQWKSLLDNEKGPS